MDIQIRRGARKFDAFLGLHIEGEDKAELARVAEEMGVAISDLARAGVKMVLDQVAHNRARSAA